MSTRAFIIFLCFAYFIAEATPVDAKTVLTLHDKTAAGKDRAGAGKARRQRVIGIAAETSMAARKTFLTREKAQTGKTAFYLISHINYARIAAGLQDAKLAEKHLQQAILLNELIAARGLKNKFLQTPAYRRSSDDDTYYRISELTGWRDLSRGPFWAGNNGIVVRHVNLVLTNFKPDTDFISEQLLGAEAAIADNNFSKAQDTLARIIVETVAAEKSGSLPLEKARDNLSLAHYYIGTENYNAARFALGQADEGLMEAESDQRLSSYQKKIRILRVKVRQLNEKVERHDPTLMTQAGEHMESWWTDLKNWSQEKL